MSLTGIQLRSSKYASLPYTAPSGGVVGGGMGKVGDTIGVFYETKDEGESVAFVYKADKILLPKSTGVAFSQGGKVYYDATAKKVTSVLTDNTLCGRAIEAAVSADPEVLAEFNGACVA